MPFKMFAGHWPKVSDWEMSFLAVIRVKDSITLHLQVPGRGQGRNESKVLYDSKDHTLNI